MECRKFQSARLIFVGRRDMYSKAWLDGRGKMRLRWFLKIRIIHVSKWSHWHYIRLRVNAKVKYVKTFRRNFVLFDVLLFVISHTGLLSTCLIRCSLVKGTAPVRHTKRRLFLICLWTRLLRFGRVRIRQLDDGASIDILSSSNNH